MAKQQTRKSRTPSWWAGAVARQQRALTQRDATRRQEKQKQMSQGLRSIAMAMDWLERHGLEVQAYEVGCWKQPSISIKAGRACDLLKSEFGGHDRCTKTDTHTGHPQRWWRADLHGCYIDWSERMH
ncbi:MAG: hypothetical protein JNM11_12575 [Chitinimonas sp.]|nr:hypothetical protein [Chitinimonas sp.]